MPQPDHYRCDVSVNFFLCLVTESDLLGQIKKNKVSKAVFLTQKALLVYMDKGKNDSNQQTRSLLEVPKCTPLFMKKKKNPTTDI